MKKLFFLNLALLVVAAFLYTSCKKTQHATLPTPANNRIMSYTKFTTSPFLYRAINENFTFAYDGEQRLTQIIYTSNDSLAINNPLGDASKLTINFVYSNDTIYKTKYFTLGGGVFEKDTFIQNAAGQITWAYTPGNIHQYGYFGKLIASDKWSVYDSGTVISATSTYTSDNGDLLNKVYAGDLSVSFIDSGYSTNPYFHDTALTPPLTVTWTTNGYPAATTVTHTTTGYTDNLTGYTSGYPVSVEAEDSNHVIIYNTTVTWPGGYLYPKESYFVYPLQINRPGDYFQIESFTTYGENMYMDAHLISQINDQGGPITNVAYTIDADSRILQTYVTKTGYGVADTLVYKYQYQTF